ncbi:MAG: UvrD-helicase domain-containing protein [Candidatus Nanopelagicales bacterium]
MSEFDLLGPFPVCTLLLEASAGTGKTYTIAALATRSLAEGTCTLDQLLLMTYTRAATRELRERVRDRIRTTMVALRTPGPHEDPVTAALASGDPVLVAERADRLERALTSFDAATIVTTHAFCQDVLSGMGIVADTDPLESFAEDLRNLETTAAGDVYLRTFAVPGAAEPPFTWHVAQDIARAAVGDPQAELDALPETADPTGTPAARQRFARQVRDEVLRRRRDTGLTTYDDLVFRVQSAVTDPGTGGLVRDQLRQRFRVVMVDEFQDTDPTQWQILHDVFHDLCTLILIGDPKQAIYAFRGGDIVTYLTARRSAGHIATLRHNHRTDAPLVAVVNTLFSGIALGDADIVVEPALAVRPDRRLHHAGAPLRLRTVDTSGRMDDLRELIDIDLTRDIAALLSRGAEIDDGGDRRHVRPGDIAVIVWRNADADRIRDRLRTAGINAVVTSTTDVLSTPARDDWLALLRALEKPQRPALVREAACSSFFPTTGTDLATDGDTLSDTTAQTLQEWAAAFAGGGVAAVLRRAEPEMTARLLSHPDGERRLTDLRHLGERLHAQGSGLAGLIEWLGTSSDADENEVTEASRRLDSDADAVQVLTVHSSKGLEFPIVYLPFAWSRHASADRQTSRFHDDRGRRILDVTGNSDPGRTARRRRSQAEEAGESLREFYVAMTRAACQVTVWWAANKSNGPASLQRVASAQVAGDREPELRYPGTTLADIEAALGVAAEPIDPATGSLTATGAAPPHLALAPFDRRIDLSWQRTSYSRLTAAAHEAHMAADPPERESDESAPAPTGDLTEGVPSPWASLPVGAAFGVVVHRVYELFDPAAPDLAGEIRRCCHEALRERPVADLGPDALAAAVLPTVTTPVTAGLALCDLPDRWAELDFEFPLAGGDERVRTVLLSQVPDLLDRHLADGDPLAPYADRMRVDGLDDTLAGFLAGSIDAVLRTPDDGRYLVVDYKTNWIGGDITARHLPLSAYHPAALTDAMMAAHYPLQALLYGVALHRFLRWRVPGYRPEHHLGGIRYLFVRGMTPEAPAPAGIFSWDPPARLITDLSDLLAGLS